MFIYTPFSIKRLNAQDRSIDGFASSPIAHNPSVLIPRTEISGFAGFMEIGRSVSL
jgi:hypothetical protein